MPQYKDQCDIKTRRVGSECGLHSVTPLQ